MAKHENSETCYSSRFLQFKHGQCAHVNSTFHALTQHARTHARSARAHHYNSCAKAELRRCKQGCIKHKRREFKGADLNLLKLPQDLPLLLWLLLTLLVMLQSSDGWPEINVQFHCPAPRRNYAYKMYTVRWDQRALPANLRIFRCRGGMWSTCPRNWKIEHFQFRRDQNPSLGNQSMDESRDFVRYHQAYLVWSKKHAGVLEVIWALIQSFWPKRTAVSVSNTGSISIQTHIVNYFSPNITQLHVSHDIYKIWI